jgi:hypothetical protein
MLDKSPEFRTRLKAAISRVMDKSYILQSRKGKVRVCIAQIHVKGSDQHSTVVIRYNINQKRPQVTYGTFCDEAEDLRHYPRLNASGKALWPTVADDAKLLEDRSKTRGRRKGIK